MNHDVIAIGASAGGVEVLLEMVEELPVSFPASIFVALHTMPKHVSPLPELLSKRGPLPASHPLDKERIAPGHIYIAPPDNHLTLRQGAMEVARGPKENGHRPAADALFRSASAIYGSRVVGVVLSGYQDCGTAGMMSIKARGGLSVVQDPETATAPEMPRSVLERVEVDYIVHPIELPGLLVRLASTPAPAEIQPEGDIVKLDGGEPGAPAELVCPACDGVLTQAQARGFLQFRCHVGHAFSLESLVREQSEAMERALWAAVRSLEESAALSRRLAATDKSDMRQRFVEKAKTQDEQADLIRDILLRGTKLTRTDAAKLSG